jgi:D-tagatose-1,6-bisphosphate aldolase subunit GatZ/KbaZ
MKSAKDIFLDIIAANRSGLAKGIYSVCSANTEVLEACFKQAIADESVLLVESTSNQVDQFGGYTGMKPSDFVNYVKSIAQKYNYPDEKLLLGGDHLGPNAWQNLPSGEAMDNAKVLISEYIKAGYQKIHLDTSMFCEDDKGDRAKPLSDEVVASRTAELCRVAEDTYARYRDDLEPPVYIIGTEVPVPGGAKEEEEEVVPTTPEDAANTISVTKKHFFDGGLDEAWERVIGVVVQPGVEFGDEQIFQYKREKAKGLSKKIEDYDGLVYEAHSTDYQTESNLKALVEDHFCILKVGPWLTFAYREALFALENMEVELLGENFRGLSKLGDTLDEVMTGNPKFWKKYYQGDKEQQLFKRKYSFSDRSRYYWPVAGLEEARKRLYENLRKKSIPASLLSQFMPYQFYQVCDKKIAADPAELVHSYIQNVTGIYSRACGMTQKI